MSHQITFDDLVKQFEEFKRQIENQISELQKSIEQIRLQFKTWWYNLPPETRTIILSIIPSIAGSIAGTIVSIILTKLLE